jgi:hypothetical protein
MTASHLAAAGWRAFKQVACMIAYASLQALPFSMQHWVAGPALELDVAMQLQVSNASSIHCNQFVLCTAASIVSSQCKKMTSCSRDPSMTS